MHHSDRGCQYLSMRYTEPLAEAGIEASNGSWGDSYDNAFGGNNQRPVQGRGYVPAESLEEHGGGRVCHLGVGGLVQPSSVIGADRQRVTGGVGSGVFSPTGRVSHSGLTQTKRSSVYLGSSI